MYLRLVLVIMTRVDYVKGMFKNEKKQQECTCITQYDKICMYIIYISCAFHTCIDWLLVIIHTVIGFKRGPIRLSGIRCAVFRFYIQDRNIV